MSTKKTRNAGGLIFERLQDGAWYIGVHPGGFTDSETGIHIPGPKAIVEEHTRKVLDICDIPEPVQIPHARLVVQPKDPTNSRSERVETEIGFTEKDFYEQSIADGLQMALSTGIIRHVPDAEVEKYFPETYAKRQEHFVYAPQRAKEAEESLADMLSRHMRVEKERDSAKESRETARHAASGGPATK